MYKSDKLGHLYINDIKLGKGVSSHTFISDAGDGYWYEMPDEGYKIGFRVIYFDPSVISETEAKRILLERILRGLEEELEDFKDLLSAIDTVKSELRKLRD